MVFPAHGAELLDLELFGHRPLVLGGRVIGAVAVTAGHLDEIAHDVFLKFIARNSFASGGAENLVV
jgi:hypothetical protein